MYLHTRQNLTNVHAIVISTLQNDYLHFTDEETEVQQKWITNSSILMLSKS